jgi:hypothetical protein
VTLSLGRLHESRIVSTTRGVNRINDQAALEERSCGCHRLAMQFMDRFPPAQPLAVAESWQESAR